MPLAHLTLTVSHIPTSTSFFLSCLQPLGYKYVGHHDNNTCVGFGSEPDQPADFWITQEMPGVPVGAAHVAFPAASRTAVHQFFTSALKAGGKIHAEPCLRDAAQGYYSAAVIDIDGNSIEAVFRDTDRGRKSEHGWSIVQSNAHGETVSKVGSCYLEAPKSEVGTTVSRARTKVSSVAPTAVTAIREAPAPEPAVSVVSEARRGSTQSDSGTQAKALVGTLLGAAAGAAIAYAMTKGEEQSNSARREREYVQAAASASVVQPHSIESAPEYMDRAISAVQSMQQAYRAIEGVPSTYSKPPTTIFSRQPDMNPTSRTVVEDEPEYASVIQPYSTVSRAKSRAPTVYSRATSTNSVKTMRATEAAPTYISAAPSSHSKAPTQVSAAPSHHTKAPTQVSAAQSSHSKAPTQVTITKSTAAPTHISSTSSRPSLHRSTTMPPALPSVVSAAPEARRASHNALISSYMSPEEYARLAHNASRANSTLSRSKGSTPSIKAAPSRVSSVLRPDSIVSASPSKISLPPSKATSIVSTSTLKPPKSSKANSIISKTGTFFSARNLPLPESVADGITTLSISPSESVSNAGSSRSKRSHHSRHSSHSHHSSHHSTRSHRSSSGKKSSSSRSRSGSRSRKGSAVGGSVSGSKVSRRSKLNEEVRPDDSISQVC